MITPFVHGDIATVNFVAVHLTVGDGAHVRPTTKRIEQWSTRSPTWMLATARHASDLGLENSEIGEQDG
jgi:hypothetical protein